MDESGSSTGRTPIVAVPAASDRGGGNRRRINKHRLVRCRSSDKIQIVLKSERNAFYDAVMKSGIDPELLAHEAADPSEFNVEELFQPGIRVRVAGTELWFAFFKAKLLPSEATPLFACRSNGYNYVTEEYTDSVWIDRGRKTAFTAPKVPLMTLDQAAANVSHWLEEVVPPFLEEQSLPDLWETRSLASTAAEIAPEVGDEPFSVEEQQRLRLAVDEIAQLLSTYDASEEQRAYVHDKLAALSDAVSRLDKSTWFTLAVGTVINVASALYLNNDQGRILLERVRDILNMALRLLP